MKRTNVSDIIYNTIKAKFINSEIEFGEAFVETTYAQQLDVSRTPLREAIKRLEHDGIIIRLPNGRLKFMDISKENIEDIFNVRLALENMLIDKCLNNNEIIQELRKNVEKSKKYFNNADFDLVRTTIPEFTKILYSSLDFQYIVNILNKNNILLNKLKSKTLITKERMEQAISEHDIICKALEDKDIQLATFTNKTHLNNTKIRILNAL